MLKNMTFLLIIHILEYTGFKIVEYYNRSDIIKEKKKILDWSSDTVFWIVRKDDM